MSYKERLLGDVVRKMATGKTPPTAQSEYFNGDINWYTPADITNKLFLNGSSRKISQKALSDKKAVVFEPNTLLITCIGNIGRVGITSGITSSNQQITGLTFNNEIDPQFAFYFFQFIQPELEQKANNAVVPILNNAGLREIKIRFPNIRKQKEIAHILSQVDNAQQQRKVANGLTEQFLQSTFLSLFGDPVRNEKGWEVRTVDKLIANGEKISYGVVQPGDDNRNGIPVIRVGDFSGMTISNSKLKRIDPIIESKYTRTRINGSEILIACVGSIGKVALVDETQVGYNIVRAVARISPNEKEINRFYLAYYLSTPLVQSYFTNETKTVAQPTLNIKQIEATEILLPPLKLQQQFAAIVAQTEALRQRQRAHAAELEEMFQGLLQRYFG